MAEFNRAGQIVTGDYMRAERKRKGFCPTCRRGDPIKCFEIKKRLCGLRREHIPLTESGNVFNGICLVCHPDQNPDKLKRKRKKSKKSKRLHDDHRQDKDKDMDEVVRLHDNSCDYGIQNPRPHNNNVTRTSTDDEQLDILAILCQNHMTLHQQESVQFVPGGQVLKNSTIKVQDGGTIISDMTSPTCFQGQPLLVTTAKSIGMASASRSRRMGTAVDPGDGYLSVISENSSGASSEMQRSMVSHQIHEPVMEDEVQKKKPTWAASTEVGNHDGQELENPSTPELSALHEVLEMFIQAGEDAEAINQITQALIIDNADTMEVLNHGHAGAKSMDLVLFCLTKFWVLARKNNENKHEIIFADLAFAAVLEAMRIHHDKVEAQARACGLLWSLCMDPKERKHVAQDGGCDAILNAMLVHTKEDAVQVMALGALKVLSSDSTGKAWLRQRGVLQIVADIMQRHLLNPTIQAEGCVILSNLVVDDNTQGVDSVTQNEIEAVVKGILAHPDSLQVHEAGCFAFRRFASAAANVELIRRNSKTTESLQLAFKKHPDEVGANILTLWKRLRLKSSDL